MKKRLIKSSKAIREGSVNIKKRKSLRLKDMKNLEYNFRSEKTVFDRRPIDENLKSDD